MKEKYSECARLMASHMLILMTGLPGAQVRGSRGCRKEVNALSHSHSRRGAEGGSLKKEEKGRERADRQKSSKEFCVFQQVSASLVSLTRKPLPWGILRKCPHSLF